VFVTSPLAEVSLLCGGCHESLSNRVFQLARSRPELGLAACEPRTSTRSRYRSLSARSPQLFFFLENGYRVIADDRRGQGRSIQTDGGNEMDTYAADVAALTEKLDLKGGGLPMTVRMTASASMPACRSMQPTCSDRP
jgi:hypothetical protein